MTILKSDKGWPVPGKSVAGITIGDSINFAISTLGQPTEIDSTLLIYTWADNKSNQLKIISKNEKVDMIEIAMSAELQKDMRTPMRIILNILHDTNAYKIGTREYKEFGIKYMVLVDSSVTYFKIFQKYVLPNWLKVLRNIKDEFLKRSRCLGMSSDSIKIIFGQAQIDNSNVLAYIYNDSKFIFSLVNNETDTVSINFSQELLDSLSLPKTLDEIKKVYGENPAAYGNTVVYIDSGITIGLKTNNYIDYIKIYHPEYENMVLIAGGDFLLGTSNEDIKDMNIALKSMAMDELKIDKKDIQDEMPQQIISLDGFYIDKYEVTNEQFQKFVNTTNYKSQGNWQNWFRPGQENYPARGVTWYDADSFAIWSGKELPTEFQWESAAKANGGYYFPWGNSFDMTELANYQKYDYQNTSDAMPVNSFNSGQSAYGVYNMAGNVKEWCRNDYIDISNYYSKVPKVNPQGTITEIEIKAELPFYTSVRGGSFMSILTSLRSSCREYLDKNNQRKDLGFRCVKEIKH
jgi:iron(II)-dependent oxidoreductase